MTTNPIRVCAIMAGGSGERFWPLSRRLHPKQLLKLNDPERNLIEETVDRISPLIPPDHIYVVTGRHLQEPIRRGTSGIPDENILAEPCKRNTAGCLTYFAAQMMARFEADFENVTAAVLTADHRIPDVERFRETAQAAMHFVDREKALGVIGVMPTRAETGYGYIEIPEGAEPLQGQENIEIYPVASFHEKPDMQTAAEMIGTGRFLWNGGMFFFQLGVFLEELEQASPPHAAAVRDMAQALRQGNEKRVEQIFESLENISIDYALMEKASRVIVIRADFAWDDIGAWNALERSHEKDEQGNVAIGDPILIQTKNSIVYNEPGEEKMAVAVVGVEDLAIIVAGDAVLVIPKDHAQDVRKAVAALKERNSQQL